MIPEYGPLTYLAIPILAYASISLASAVKNYFSADPERMYIVALQNHIFHLNQEVHILEANNAIIQAQIDAQVAYLENVLTGAPAA